MVSSIKCDPSDLRNSLEPWVHRQACDLVVLPVDEQCLDLDLVPFPPTLPAPNGTHNDELCWALDGQIDGWIFLQVFVPSQDFFGEGVQSTDEHAVEDFGCLLERLTLMVALAVTILQGLSDVRWQLSKETLETLDVQ